MIIANKLTANVTLGEISNFVYDGQGLFIGQISSNVDGKGEVDVSFDNQSLTLVTLPEDLNQSATSEIQKLEYRFIAAGVLGTTDTGIDSDGKPRRDISDI